MAPFACSVKGFVAPRVFVPRARASFSVAANKGVVQVPPTALYEGAWKSSKAALLGLGAAYTVAAGSLLFCDAANASPSFTEAQLLSGGQVFGNNCAACHTGGRNVIESDKTLEKEALTEYLTGGFNLDAIVYQVKNGKGAMPAWAASLSEQQIQDVAAYVYNQADKELWDA